MKLSLILLEDSFINLNEKFIFLIIKKSNNITNIGQILKSSSLKDWNNKYPARIIKKIAVKLIFFDLPANQIPKRKSITAKYIVY